MPHLCNVIVYFSYKHAIDGLYRVYSEEGVRRLFGGASMATSRAVLMTVGQISFYDQIKQTLLGTVYFEDNIITHLLSSLSAVSNIIITSGQELLDFFVWQKKFLFLGTD